MSSDKNQNGLWGDLPDISDTASPMQILEDQAALLSSATGGALKGVVGRRAGPDMDKVFATLYVVAPFLDGYRYSVCEISYDPANQFDVRLLPHASANAGPVFCRDENQFREKLGAILQSESVRNAITSLIRESRVRSRKDG